MITDSMKKAQLNATNRPRFVDAILREAFGARSAKLRKEYEELMRDMLERTWGKTGQARAALRKKVIEWGKLRKVFRDKGLSLNYSTVGNNSLDDMTLNIGGMSFNAAIKINEMFNDAAVFAIDQHALSGGDTYVEVDAFSSKLTLLGGDKLSVRFFAIKDEAEALEAAALELGMQVSAVMSSSRTFGAALDKWPTLEKFGDAILSQSRVVMVRPEILDAKITALKSGDGSVRDAMAAK
jgi:hypothetical protein